MRPEWWLAELAGSMAVVSRFVRASMDPKLSLRAIEAQAKGTSAARQIFRLVDPAEEEDGDAEGLDDMIQKLQRLKDARLKSESGERPEVPQ